MPFRKPTGGNAFKITNREYTKTGGTPHRAFPTVCYPRCCGNAAAYEKPPRESEAVSLCWHYLSSRQVTLQVLSARTSLTSVFGMGPGGPSSQSIPTHVGCTRQLLCQKPELLTSGAPSGTRTRDPLIKSQLLYQLS